MLLLAACSSSSGGSSTLPPSSSASVRVRFAEGAPELEAIINGVPTGIGTAYLQVDGETLNSSFNYGTMTQFLILAPGKHSLEALDDLGYRVGPIRTTALSAGKQYTVVLVGSYPTYRVLTFEEPADSSGAQLSLYEASPTVPSADFGSFRASSHSGFKKLGSATLGSIVTLSLGTHVSDFGGYVDRGVKPLSGGTVTPAQINAFDADNALPFHSAARLSLFLFDTKQGSSSGPVFGSLDR
jgi:hypothetical protein